MCRYLNIGVRVVEGADERRAAGHGHAAAQRHAAHAQLEQLRLHQPQHRRPLGHHHRLVAWTETTHSPYKCVSRSCCSLQEQTRITG